MASLLGSSPSRPSLNYSSVTDKGLNRDNNEDCLLSIPERGVWLVADGMGGHEAGEVASAIVRDTVQAKLDKPGLNGASLPEAIQQAHTAVLDAARNGIGATGMGSTVVALHNRDQEYEIAWVGDSRAYLWTREPGSGHLEQLTTDHSYVQLLLASGAITKKEVDNHPDKNVITQCIGSTDLAEINIDTVCGRWQQHQWILLCSDGLTDEVDDKTIARILYNASSPKDAVNHLLQAALDSGGRDNITLQVIESPLDFRNPLTSLDEWLPAISGHRRLDNLLYGLALVSLLLLCYWLFIGAC